MEAKRNYIEPRCKAIFVESQMIADSKDPRKPVTLQFDYEDEEDEGYGD